MTGDQWWREVGIGLLIVMSLVVSFFWRGLMRVRTRVLIQVSRRGIVDGVLGLSGGNELSGFFVCIFVRQVVIVCLSLQEDSERVNE